MKKVLFILPSLGIGGMERVLVTIANKLVQNSYDVTVMILSPIEDMKDELDDKVHFFYKPPKQHIGNRIPYIRHKYYDDGMWETRTSAKQLYDYYVGNDRYDVEIAFFRGMPVKIISGSSNTKATHLAWVHNDFRHAVGYLNNFVSLKQVFDAYKSMDHVICVSKEAGEGFREAIGNTDNLVTVYNLLPVDEIRKKADLTPDVKTKRSRFHIVLVARLLDSAKGQKRMINVVHRLREEGRDVSLALVGGGQDEQMLRKLVHDYNAEDYVTITGSQTNPYPHIKEADLLVCASYFEGYNLTVAEALILGVPVLSTDCTGPNEILDHGKYGMIVENSEEGLYNGLRQFVDSQDLLKKYKEKAMNRYAFFDEDPIMRQVWKLF